MKSRAPKHELKCARSFTNELPLPSTQLRARGVLLVQLESQRASTIREYGPAAMSRRVLPVSRLGGPKDFEAVTKSEAACYALASKLLTDFAYHLPPQWRANAASIQGIGNLMERSLRRFVVSRG